MSQDPNALKTTADKLKESMRILQELQDAGVAATDPSYKELSKRFSEWVKGTEPWNGTVNFYRYNRRAVVNLPVKARYTAKLDFLHHVF